VSPVKHAVLVGVSDYETLPNLPSCKFDVLSVYDSLLGAGFRAENISLLAESLTDQELSQRPLTSTKPSRTFLEDALDHLEARVDKPDSVVFYFSGHGINAGTDYLCPPETRSNRLGSTALLLNDILARLDSLGTPHVNVVLDACRDELNQEQKSAASLKGLGDPSLQSSIEALKNVSVLFSCQPEEKSYVVPTPEPQRGAFTIAVVDAIRDPNLVTLDALAKYTQRNVQVHNDGYQQGRVQRPLIVNGKTEAALVALYGDPKVLSSAVLEVTSQLEAFIPPLPMELFDKINAFVKAFWNVEKGIRTYMRDMINDLCTMSVDDVDEAYFMWFAQKWDEYEQMIPGVRARATTRSSEPRFGAEPVSSGSG